MVIPNIRDQGGELREIKYLQKVIEIIINNCIITSLPKEITGVFIVPVYKKLTITPGRFIFNIKNIEHLTQHTICCKY